MLFSMASAPGDGWVFPTAPDKANTVAGMLNSRTPQPPSCVIARSHPIFRAAQNALVGPIKGYPLRTDFHVRRVATANLVGGESSGRNHITVEGIDYPRRQHNWRKMHLNGQHSKQNGLDPCDSRHYRRA